MVLKLSERLTQIRKRRNLLQKDIARDIGTSLRGYQYYEAGMRVPNCEVLIKLCNYLHVSADYLLGLSDSTKFK